MNKKLPHIKTKTPMPPVKQPKTHDKIIDKIQKVRKKNNRAWMSLLRLAFKHAPDEAKKIFSDITKNDTKINELSKELCSE